MCVYISTVYTHTYFYMNPFPQFKNFYSRTRQCCLLAVIFFLSFRLPLSNNTHFCRKYHSYKSPVPVPNKLPLYLNNVLLVFTGKIPVSSLDLDRDPQYDSRSDRKFLTLPIQILGTAFCDNIGPLILMSTYVFSYRDGPTYYIYIFFLKLLGTVPVAGKGRATFSRTQGTGTVNTVPLISQVPLLSI
jgi:hypothetical protein